MDSVRQRWRSLRSIPEESTNGAITNKSNGFGTLRLKKQLNNLWKKSLGRSDAGDLTPGQQGLTLQGKLKCGSMTALSARTLYPEFSYSLQDLSSGPCTCRETTPKKRPGLAGKFARVIENPFSSLSSRKSILECDLTAYDLIRNYVNSEDLNDNALVDGRVVVKPDEWSVSSESPSSESGIYSQSSSIRVAGQGLRLDRTNKGSGPDSPYWSASSDEAIYTVPEPDYGLKESAKELSTKNSIIRSVQSNKPKNQVERKADPTFSTFKSKPPEEFAKDAKEELEKLRGLSKNGFIKGTQTTETPSKAPLPAKNKIRPNDMKKNLSNGSHFSQSPNIKQAKFTPSSANGSKPKEDFPMNGSKQPTEQMTLKHGTGPPSPIDTKTLVAKKCTNEKRKFATIAVRVHQDTPVEVKSILRKSAGDAEDSDTPSVQQSLAGRKKKHVHFDAPAASTAESSTKKSESKGKAAQSKKLTEDPSKKRTSSEVRRTLPPPPPPPRKSSVQSVPPTDNCTTLKSNLPGKGDEKKVKTPLEIPRPTLKKTKSALVPESQDPAKAALIYSPPSKDVPSASGAQSSSSLLDAAKNGEDQGDNDSKRPTFESFKPLPKREKPLLHPIAEVPDQESMKDPSVSQIQQLAVNSDVQERSSIINETPFLPLSSCLPNGICEKNFENSLSEQPSGTDNSGEKKPLSNGFSCFTEELKYKFNKAKTDNFSHNAESNTKKDNSVLKKDEALETPRTTEKPLKQTNPYPFIVSVNVASNTMPKDNGYSGKEIVKTGSSELTSIENTVSKKDANYQNGTRETPALEINCRNEVKIQNSKIKHPGLSKVYRDDLKLSRLKKTNSRIPRSKSDFELNTIHKPNLSKDSQNTSALNVADTGESPLCQSESSAKKDVENDLKTFVRSRSDLGEAIFTKRVPEDGHPLNCGRSTSNNFNGDKLESQSRAQHNLPTKISTTLAAKRHDKIELISKQQQKNISNYFNGSTRKLFPSSGGDYGSNEEGKSPSATVTVVTLKNGPNATDSKILKEVNFLQGQVTKRIQQLEALKTGGHSFPAKDIHTNNSQSNKVHFFNRFQNENTYPHHKINQTPQETKANEFGMPRAPTPPSQPTSPVTISIDIQEKNSPPFYETSEKIAPTDGIKSSFIMMEEVKETSAPEPLPAIKSKINIISKQQDNSFDILKEIEVSKSKPDESDTSEADSVSHYEDANEDFVIESNATTEALSLASGIGDDSPLPSLSIFKEATNAIMLSVKSQQGECEKMAFREGSTTTPRPMTPPLNRAHVLTISMDGTHSQNQSKHHDSCISAVTPDVDGAKLAPRDDDNEGILKESRSVVVVNSTPDEVERDSQKKNEDHLTLLSPEPVSMSTSTGSIASLNTVNNNINDEIYNDGLSRSKTSDKIDLCESFKPSIVTTPLSASEQPLRTELTIITPGSQNNASVPSKESTISLDQNKTQELPPNSEGRPKNNSTPFKSAPKYVSPFLAHSNFYDHYTTKRIPPLKPSNNDTIYGIPLISYPLLPRKENAPIANGTGSIRIRTFYNDIDNVREELESRKSDSGYPESEQASPTNMYETVQGEEDDEEENFYDVINDDLICSDHPIYDDISYRDIYEEIPDKLIMANNSKNKKYLDDVSPVPKKSIFHGASRDEILGYLEVAKDRLVDSDISDFDDVGDHEVLRLEGGWKRRIQSNDTAFKSDGSPNPAVKVDRHDSGLGSLLSASRSPLTPTSSTEGSCCRDCSEPLSSMTDNSPTLCPKCRRKRAERKDIINEIVETEAKYGQDLSIMKEVFYVPMQVAGLLNEEQLKGVFLNLDQLMDANQTLTDKLKESLDQARDRSDQDYLTVNIGKLFLESDYLLEAFESYCTRQGCASLLLTSLEKDKELLRIFLRVSQLENSRLRRMSLAAFLMVPVQRVTKYPLLLNRLYKTTPLHHPDKEALRQAQNKVELHLDQMNEKTKATSGVKLWRRISLISSSPRRYQNLIDVGSIKLRKLALEVLGWDRDDMRVPLAGKVLGADPRKGDFLLMHALLVTLGTPSESYRPDLGSRTPPRAGTGLAEAALILARDRGGRLTLFREPLILSRTVVSVDEDDPSIIELSGTNGKEWLLLKGEVEVETREWYRMLCYHARDLGHWRRRRNALANIMMSNFVPRQLDPT